MDVTAVQIKELREISGAGVMDCRRALLETSGDIAKAVEFLKKQALYHAQKKAERVVKQGVIENYIHTGGRIGAMVELNCETDFVARTDVFKELAHNIAMQVAAQEPLCISQDKMHKDSDVPPEVACLLLQPFIKNPTMTIQDLINEVIARTGENIKVNRFARFELGAVEARIAGV
ncbi:MAG: elongation factor Ts [Dehalococcoidia bacterium]|nr:elongation factor Ts [Dehalococcoidia bacterium]